MIDWKILAASFAALLVVSSVLVGDFGIRDFFSGLVEKITELLGGSPFGAFSIPGAGHAEIDLNLYPENITFQPDGPVNITSESITIENFQGSVTTGAAQESAVFEESRGFRITMQLNNNITIHGLSIGKLSVPNVKFELTSNQSRIDSESGLIELYNFAGDAVIQRNHIALKGNVSRARGDTWEIGQSI